MIPILKHAAAAISVLGSFAHRTEQDVPIGFDDVRHFLDHCG